MAREQRDAWPVSARYVPQEWRSVMDGLLQTAVIGIGFGYVLYSIREINKTLLVLAQYLEAIARNTQQPSVMDE